jgi:hypothetical protein
VRVQIAMDPGGDSGWIEILGKDSCCGSNCECCWREPQRCRQASVAKNLGLVPVFFDVAATITSS